MCQPKNKRGLSPILTILKSMLLVAWVQARLVSSHFGFARVLYRQNGRLDWIPIPVRLATRTRGHDLVVMLAYRIIQTLTQYWHALDVTVAEGLQELEALGVTDIVLANSTRYHRIPQPRPLSQQLLEAARVKLPTVWPRKGVQVVTEKKLTSRRKDV